MASIGHKKDKDMLETNEDLYRSAFEITGDGFFNNSASVVRDITELRQLQNQLEIYSKDLEKLVEERTKQLKDSERLAAIGATAGMVGHDIRNPLQAITGDLFLAKSELADVPDYIQKQNALEKPMCD